LHPIFVCTNINSGGKKMRLKFLFFPIILVVSVSIFILYVWPEIGNFKIANENKKTATQALQEIGEKQKAIEQLGTQISNSSDDKTLVDNYLPNKKVEEQIIAGINYLALDSQVSLVDVSIKDIEPAESGLETSPSIVSSINTSVATTKSGEVPVAAGNTLSTNANSGMKFSRTTIKVSGEYEKIRLFLDQLQRMPLLNTIKSINIYNQPENSVNPNSGNNNSTSTLSNILVSDIVIDFGYLKPSVFDNNKISIFKPELDKETVSLLKQYVSQKTVPALPTVGIGGDRGKANPFLP
jgi:Tfp pilus assembly protein PilO